MLLNKDLARKLDKFTEKMVSEAWKAFVQKQIDGNQDDLENADKDILIYRSQGKATLLKELYNLPEFIRSTLVEAKEVEELEDLRAKYN